jgi:hypothetical protein
MGLNVNQLDACDGAPGNGHLGWLGIGAVAEVDSFTPRRLHLAVGLDDGSIVSRFPSYDGLERVFACVPRRPGPYGERRNYRRFDLAWRETRLHEGRFIDIHRTDFDATDDLATDGFLWGPGVYFGLESNGQILWAAAPGEDVVIRPIDESPPTEAPLPR